MRTPKFILFLEIINYLELFYLQSSDDANVIMKHDLFLKFLVYLLAACIALCTMSDACVYCHNYAERSILQVLLNISA